MHGQGEAARGRKLGLRAAHRKAGQGRREGLSAVTNRACGCVSPSTPLAALLHRPALPRFASRLPRPSVLLLRPSHFSVSRPALALSPAPRLIDPLVCLSLFSCFRVRPSPWRSPLTSMAVPSLSSAIRRPRRASVASTRRRRTSWLPRLSLASCAPLSVPMAWTRCSRAPTATSPSVSSLASSSLYSARSHCLRADRSLDRSTSFCFRICHSC